MLLSLAALEAAGPDALSRQRHNARIGPGPGHHLFGVRLRRWSTSRRQMRNRQALAAARWTALMV